MQLPPKLKKILIFFLLICHFFILVKTNILHAGLSGSVKFLDFDNYFWMSKAVLKGKHPYQQNPAFTQTLGPPLVIFFYIPFTVFPIKTARRLITFGNLFSLYLCCWLISKYFFKKEDRLTKILITLFISFVFLTSFPARFSILMGQPLLITTLVVFLSYINENSFLKASFLSSASVIKTFLVFPSLAWINKRKLLFPAFTAVFTTITLISFAFIKPQYYLDFSTQRLASITLKTETLNNNDYYNQSLKSTLNRFRLRKIYRFLYPLLITASSWYLIKTTDFQKGVVLSLLLAPVCWQHYLVIVFPFIIEKIIEDISFKKPFFNRRVLIEFVILGLWWIQIGSLHQSTTSFLFSLLASHYFFSLLLLLLI